MATSGNIRVADSFEDMLKEEHARFCKLTGKKISFVAYTEIVASYSKKPIRFSLYA